MPTEWIDVVDNAVKIGFPSILTGVITLYSINHSQKSSQKKFAIEHKTKILEQISEDVDRYFNAWNMLFSKVGAITKRMQHDIEMVVLNKSQLDAIKQRDKDLVQSWSKKHISLARLRLLKAESTATRLLDCSEMEKRLRELLIFDKKYPNYNQIVDMKKEALVLQEAFHKELADLYESITS